MPAGTLGRHTSNALGTFVTLLVAEPGDLDAARDLLTAELAAIDVACSRFRADSELSRACAAGGRPVPVSPLFAEALSAGLAAAELTAGTSTSPAGGPSSPWVMTRTSRPPGSSLVPCASRWPPQAAGARLSSTPSARR